MVVPPPLQVPGGGGLFESRREARLGTGLLPSPGVSPVAVARYGTSMVSSASWVASTVT